jgi:hypothetical protein
MLQAGARGVGGRNGGRWATLGSSPKAHHASGFGCVLLLRVLNSSLSHLKSTFQKPLTHSLDDPKCASRLSPHLLRRTRPMSLAAPEKASKLITSFRVLPLLSALFITWSSLFFHSLVRGTGSLAISFSRVPFDLTFALTDMRAL